MSNRLVFKLPTHHSWTKLTAVSAFASLLPFGLLMGVFALFGANTVWFEGQTVVGWAGLLSGVAISAFIAGAVTFFAATFGYIGLWLFSRFRPIKLEYLPETDRNENS